MTLGVVVIGRNEGERLRRAIESCRGRGAHVLYVDSGSTDGSVKLARELGVAVLGLCPSRPFSAARGRKEGFEWFAANGVDVDHVQFVDGDCCLDRAWLECATGHLAANADVGIVCGGLEEEHPEASVFNRMNSIRWQAAAPGDIESCGGIFMVRRAVYEAAGGFDDRLITGEEAEFCVRVRASGARIVRLPAPMASHDSNMVRFGDWWKRAVWGGYGDAHKLRAQVDMGGASEGSELRSALLWGAVVPAVAVLGAVVALWVPWLWLVPLSCVAGYLLLFAKIAAHRLRQGDGFGDAAVYSALCVVRKTPFAVGVLRFFASRGGQARPDPHARA